MDFLGNIQGWGDNGCFENLQDYHLEFCGSEDDSCMTSFEAEWEVTGKQVYTIRRGCAQPGSETGPLPKWQDNCISGKTPNNMFHFKTCFEYCDALLSYGCNTGTDITKQFETRGVESCRVCADHLEYGQITDCAANEATSFKCPNFADSACFSSIRSHDSEAYAMTDTFHGCSSFRVTSDSRTCIVIGSEENGITANDHVCKETCKDNDCNYKFYEAKRCYVCSQMVDYTNQTVGIGNEYCWGEPAAEYLMDCGVDEPFCLTKMEVDWTNSGEVYTSLIRSCSAEPADPKKLVL